MTAKGTRPDRASRQKGGASFPVLASVAALAALAVVMTQAVAFLVLLLAPEPRPSGLKIQAAAEALNGRPAETGDGRPLTRRISDAPIGVSVEQSRDPLAVTLRATLAGQLGVPLETVRLRVERRGPPDDFRRRPPPPAMPPQAAERPDIGATPLRGEGVVVLQRQTVTSSSGWRVERREGSGTPPRIVMSRPRDGNAPGRLPPDASTRQFSVLVDRVTFDPFSASLRLPDGRWATVEPPRDLIAPWQMRILLSMLVSMLILAPVVWILARRITRPIRAFAEAAERLGADPDSEPLAARGPTEVRIAIAAFNEMQDSIRGHIRQRTQTVAAIAHDLRTPLTRLRFRAEQAPDALRDRMADDIEEMDALIGQAMAYVRGETPPERLEPLDLNMLVEGCAVGFAETGVDVIFRGGVRLDVVGDPAGLRRAVANLIDNAVKFGGAARVSTGILDGMATVTVEDDGPGLAETELEAVLEPFVRGEQSRNRETGGAGLGLAVARQAARASGGDLVLSNRPGGGLNARLSLPLGR